MSHISHHSNPPHMIMDVDFWQAKKISKLYLKFQKFFSLSYLNYWGKCIQMSTNKPSIGSVILVIALKIYSDYLSASPLPLPLPPPP